MAGKKSRKQSAQDQSGSMVELNVMPFVDIFSLLCTFLLFSAVFVSIGILQVQVPFLSNADPGSDNGKENSEKSLDIKVEVNSSQIVIFTHYDGSSASPSGKTFQRTSTGLKDFHDEMVRIKDGNVSTDKVTIFVDDAVIYEDLVKILDRIKQRYPEGPLQEGEESTGDGKEMSLFPKVVMGDILL